MEPITWTQFHLDIANAIKGRTRPVSVCGLSVGGAFAAQFLATASQGEPIKLSEAPTTLGLAIDIYPSMEMDAIASLGMDTIAIYPDGPSRPLPWEGLAGVGKQAPAGPKLPTLLRELADYIDITSGA